MSTETTGSVQLRAHAIGGIDETTVAFEPGVTILAGRNATNRTSLLQAIMAALGSDDASLKADADEGGVELAMDGETYTRTLTRENGAVATSGSPYLDDATLADLFAFLLESNEARRAVRAGADLRPIIMRPIDTDAIQAEIDRLVDRRRSIDEELAALDDLKARLPTLEERRRDLRAEVEEAREKLEDVESRLADRDADVEQTQAEQAELEETLAELRETRSDLEDLRYEIETEAESLENLRTDRRDLEAAYEDLPDTPGDELAEIEAEIERLRAEKRDLESTLTELENVVRFNESRLSDSPDPGLADANRTDGGAVTDDLLPDETVVCWTCGSEVETDQIEATVDALRERSQATRAEIEDCAAELAELTERRDELQGTRRERERLEERLEEREREIEETEDRIDELTERRERRRAEIERLESTVAELENDAYDEILDLHREANELEYELGQLETELDDVEEEIAEIEDRLDAEDRLATRREEITAELEERRTRIERVEREAVGEFNDHMDTLLELLDYDNLERIWLEGTEREVREGRRTVTESRFELHVVRKTEGNATYEDAIDNLSESEREVTGLVFALAGFLAHDVHEEVPFMLLDSLEAIDADRIARLVEYFESFSDHLVIALLPEDARALPDGYQRVSEI